MSDTTELDFPPIDTAPPATQTAVAVAASQALDLEKMDLRTIALSAYKPAREQAAQAAKTLAGVVHDLSTQAKVDAAKSLRQRLINAPMADVRKITKGIKSKLAAASKAVGEEEDQVLAEFDKADALITPQIDAREAELEAERQARAAAEAARKAKHEENLQRLTGAAQRARDTGADSTKIVEGIVALEGLPISEAWEEYRERGEQARLGAIEALRSLHAEVLAREQQAVENERLRLLAAAQAAELERLRKAEADRVRAEEEERAAATPTTVATELPEWQPPQQVLKAEPATADATDRGVVANASPVGGPVGAGQPAAAGPVGGDSDAQLLADCLALVRYAQTAFDTKFPSHPKPSEAWWAGLRVRVDALAPRIEAATGGV